MNEHLSALIKNELKSAGADLPAIGDWQNRFENAKPEEWPILFDDMKKTFSNNGTLFDKEGRIDSYIRSSKVEFITEKEQKVVEPPEEIVEALTSVLKAGKPEVLLKNESKMTYTEITDALARICITRLNNNVSVKNPSLFKLPFLITKSDMITGQVVSQTMNARRSIPLVTLWASSEETIYQFFGQPAPKNFRRIAQNLDEFYVYKMRTNTDHDVFLFSKEELKLVASRIIGMRINATDFIKIGEMAKLSSSTPCYFVHSQIPEIKEISEAEFDARRKYFSLDSLCKEAFGAYRQPEWFEKLILAWMFSAKYSDYPLHLAVLSPAGVGKTFMMEGLAALTGESVASGSNDTIRGLVPSFGNGIAREGYLATCKRFAFLDEFFAMIKKSNNQSSSETDSGTFLMLEMLEHKDREVRSGVGSIRVNPRMKVLLIANSKAYNRLKTMVEISEELNYAFLSRFLWYSLTPQHKQFIQDRKQAVSILDRKDHSPRYSPSFIEMVDYLSARPVKGIDAGRIFSIRDKYRQFISADLADRIYDPRADHHLLTLLDGIAKLNSIIERRANIEVRENDYEETEKIFGDMVLSWTADVNLREIPEKHRVSYLTEAQRRVYDFVEKNPGAPTPDINLHLGAGADHHLRNLEHLGVLKTVTDLDGITKLWYPYWTRL